MWSTRQRLENWFCFNLIAQKDVSVSAGIWLEVNLAYDVAAGRVRGCWVSKWRTGGSNGVVCPGQVPWKEDAHLGQVLFFKMLTKGLAELWEKLIPSAWRSSDHLGYPSQGLHVCNLRLGRPKAGRVAVCVSALPLLLSHLFLSVVGDGVSV